MLNSEEFITQATICRHPHIAFVSISPDPHLTLANCLAETDETEFANQIRHFFSITHRQHTFSSLHYINFYADQMADCLKESLKAYIDFMGFSKVKIDSSWWPYDVMNYSAASNSCVIRFSTSKECGPYSAIHFKIEHGRLQQVHFNKLELYDSKHECPEEGLIESRPNNWRGFIDDLRREFSFENILNSYS